MTTYRCDKHDVQVSGPCPQCVDAFATRRDASTMTGDERAAEFKWWGNILTIPFSDLHQRIEELVGRPVFTHELASPESLIEEARTQRHISMADVLDKIPRDKQVIVVTPD